jgi:phytoene dehydrogenase-like protein
MSSTIIIGAGHNGLAAAFYLARAGRKPLVLERRPEVGGGAITAELHAGFRCPALSHEVLLHERIVRDMDLPRHGLTRIERDASCVCALPADGEPLVLYDDPAKSAGSIQARSAADAAAYGAFRAATQQVATVLGTLLASTPPDIDNPSPRDLWHLLRTGRRFRALGRRDAYRLLRWVPMPVADLVREWFTTDLLCAAVAAPGVSGTMLGPRSAGSALVLLLREAHRQLAGASLQVRGGPGAVTQAMAAAAVSAGAEIRLGTGVDRILVRDGHVAGVIAGGREIAASAVVSAVDPRTTMLGLMDPADLTPDYLARMKNYRAHGTVAKVNLALSSLPVFRSVRDPAMLTGRIHIGPDLDYLERAFDRAKYGEPAVDPWLDMRIPSIIDPQLAPPGAHVASIYVHYAPYRLRGLSWADARNELLAAVLRTLERYAPGVSATVVAAHSITPLDLEREYGFAGGHIFHGELALDQLFTMRPLLGYARYDSPIRGLFLCSAGTHPGGFMTGASGRLAAHQAIKAS